MNGAVSYYSAGYSDFWILPLGALLILVGCWGIGLMLSRDARKTHAKGVSSPLVQSDGANPQYGTPQLNLGHARRRKGEMG